MCSGPEVGGSWAVWGTIGSPVWLEEASNRE